MFCFYGVGSREVGDGARYFEDAVVGAGGEADAFHCRFEQAFAGVVDGADPLHHVGGHHGVAVNRWVVGETVGLALAGLYHAFADGFAGFGTTVGRHLVKAHGHHLHVKVDAV